MPAFAERSPTLAGRLFHILCAVLLTAAVGLAAAQRAAALTTFAEGATATSLPSGAGSSGNYFLDQTSCGSPGSCISVGHYTDTTGGQEAVVEPITNGTPGTAVEVTLPAGAAGGSSQNAGLVEASCWAGGSCEAVGYYNDSSGNQQAMVVPISNGTVGSATEVSLPANASTTSVNPDLSGVSCWPSGSSGSCIAVGEYNGGGLGYSQALVVPITNGTAGSGTTVSLPAGANGTPSSILSDVSCWAAGSCVAVGDYEDSASNEQALVVPISNDSAQTGLEAAEPGNAIGSGSQDAFLTYVNCPATGSCAAVGYYQDSSNNQQLLAVPISNSTPGGGAEITLPSDADASFDNVGGLNVNGLSCSSIGACDAVGTYENTAGNTEALVMPIANGTPGAAVELPLPADAGSTQNAGLNDISCVASGSCEAVGYYENGSGKDEALALTLSGSSLGSAAEVTAPSESTSSPFSSLDTVGCSAAGSCAAVGNEDNPSSVYAPYVVSFESPLAIATPNVTAGALATPYQLALSASGAWDSYTWSISSGSLPAGLSLNAQTGEISGTPTASGSSTFTVEATAPGVPIQTATQSLSLNVLAPAVAAPSGALKAVKNQISVSLDCTDAPCDGTVELETTEVITVKHGKKHVHKRRIVIVGTASYSAAAGQDSAISVTLNAAGRRLLKAAKHNRLSVTVMVSSTGGNSVTRTTELTEKVSKPKHKKKHKKKH